MSDKPLTMPEVEAECELASRLTVDARNQLLVERGSLIDTRILEAAVAAVNKYEQVTAQLLATMQERDKLLDLSRNLDEHPEDYDGPCPCRTCLSGEEDSND